MLTQAERLVRPHQRKAAVRALTVDAVILASTVKRASAALHISDLDRVSNLLCWSANSEWLLPSTESSAGTTTAPKMLKGGCSRPGSSAREGDGATDAGGCRALGVSALQVKLLAPPRDRGCMPRGRKRLAHFASSSDLFYRNVLCNLQHRHLAFINHFLGESLMEHRLLPMCTKIPTPIPCQPISWKQVNVHTPFMSTRWNQKCASLVQHYRRCGVRYFQPPSAMFINEGELSFSNLRFRDTTIRSLLCLRPSPGT